MSGVVRIKASNLVAVDRQLAQQLTLRLRQRVTTTIFRSTVVEMGAIRFDRVVTELPNPMIQVFNRLSATVNCSSAGSSATRLRVRPWIPGFD
jgi:hypothetical protein